MTVLVPIYIYIYIYILEEKQTQSDLEEQNKTIMNRHNKEKKLKQ